MPGAVEALPPPMNIKNILNSKEESSISPIETALNPAVRGDTA